MVDTFRPLDLGTPRAVRARTPPTPGRGPGDALPRPRRRCRAVPPDLPADGRGPGAARPDLAGNNPVLTHRFLCPASRLAELRAHLTFPIRLGLILDTPDVPSPGDVAVELVEVRQPPGDSPAAVSERLNPLLPGGARLFVEVPPGNHTFPPHDTAPPGSLPHDATRPSPDSPPGSPPHDVTRPGLKFRCGGLTADAFPTAHDLGAAITHCVEHGIPFKATAGLHNAVRHFDPALGVDRHGFLNLVLAVCAAVEGRDPVPVLKLTDVGELVRLARAVPDDIAEAGQESAGVVRLVQHKNPDRGPGGPRSDRSVAVRGRGRGPPGPAEVRREHQHRGERLMSWGLENLPYGVFSRNEGEIPRVGVRYGDHVVDLAGALHDEVFATGSLNAFLSRGPAAWRDTRAVIQNKLSTDQAAVEPHLIPLDQVDAASADRGGRLRRLLLLAGARLQPRPDVPPRTRSR